MSVTISQPWFFPTPTGDVGRDRNARTLQFSCLLFTIALGVISALDMIEGAQVPWPIVLATVGLLAAAAVNRVGKSAWAGRIAVLVLMSGAILLVFEAHDGFRSHAMLVFPGLLLISVMLLDRVSYMATASLVLFAVATLGIAEKHGITQAIPGIRTPESYYSILYVELTLTVFAVIGSRIARDAQSNASDLHTSIDQLLARNLELTKTTEALREREQEQASVYNAVRDVIFHLAVEPEGQFRFVSVNPAFLRVTGLSRELVVGKTVSEVIPEPSLTMVLSKYQQAIEEQTNVFWEQTYNYPTGRLTGEVVIVPVFDSKGTCTHLVGSVHDITDRNLAEAALRESEERFRATFFQAAVGITQTGRDGQWLLMNDRFCEILGYSRAELLGKTFLDVTHPDDREASFNAVRQLKAGEISSWSTEKRYIRKDGTTVWARLVTSVVRDEHNQPQYAISVVEDVTEGKQAEAELSKSEERFRATFFQAAVGIAQTGLDGQWLLLNDRLCQMLGYSRAELSAMTFLDVTHPDDRDANVVAREQFLAGEISLWSTEKRYVHKNGATVWAKVHVSLVRDQHSQPKYFISVVEDVTERKLIEERLRASEIRLREAQRLAKLGSWERLIDTDTIRWSDEVLHIFGVPAEAMSNFLAFLSHVHPKDRAKILKADSDVRSSSEPVEVEYRIMRPDGATRFVCSIVEAIRNDQGVPIHVVGATQDITEQIKARELLRESEKRLKNAERLAHVGHWHWDLNSDQVFWSEEMFHIFGQTRDYPPSYEGFFHAVIPQDRERLRGELRDALADHSGFSSEVQIARPNGDLRTITFVAEVLLDEESLLTGMFGAIQDITDLRRAQRADFARQKLESIGTLASGIAHDFNNLLGSVLVQAEVALRGLAAGSSPKDELQTIRDVALRGSEIVRELMIYAGKESVVEGLVDVSKIVREMLELLKVSVSKHAVLEADLCQDLPSVRANAAQLRQIVMNLITNASDAVGDRNGVIRLSTRRVKVDQDPEAISDRLEDGDYVQLEVSDTGRGMLPETQAKAFDPFFTTKSAGHGLGLAMVNGIVRSLGGAIHLTSEPGKGTTFQILLPCGEINTAEDSSKISGIEDLGRPFPDATVLIVEDEGPLRQAVTKMLRKSGFDVLEVGDGSSAIDLLRVNGDKIDLILLDMTIPGAASSEVAAEAEKFCPDARVILTSAYSQEMIAPSMNASRVRGFIRKPFQLGELEKTLRDALFMGH